VPQSVDPASARPHQPPRISVESIPLYLLSPVAKLQRSALDPQGCSCDVVLNIPVILDDDPLAQLEVRWFVDYDPAQPQTQRQIQTDFIDGSFDSTAVARPGPRNFVFDVTRIGITGDGYHVVDVVVAESGGFDDQSATLPHRGMKPGYESSSHRFVVNVITNNNAHCPIVPPSSLVCAGTGP
jgi:hypothetical protein